MPRLRIDPERVDTAAEQLASFFRERRIIEVGVHLVPSSELLVTQLAARMCDIEVVGLDAQPSVIVTADAAFVDGSLQPLKNEVDAAVPEARTVIVARWCDDLALAPTLDAYLDVPMIAGRDVWLHEVCGAGYVGASG